MKSVIEIIPVSHTAALVAHYRGSGKGKPILLSGHMDVVTADPKDWTRHPFTPIEQNRYIYGPVRAGDAEIQRRSEQRRCRCCDFSEPRLRRPAAHNVRGDDARRRSRAQRIAAAGYGKYQLPHFPEREH